MLLNELVRICLRDQIKSEESFFSSVTHGVSHRGQAHDIASPCLLTNPVSFTLSVLHLKGQFTQK